MAASDEESPSPNMSGGLSRTLLTQNVELETGKRSAGKGEGTGRGEVRRDRTNYRTKSSRRADGEIVIGLHVPATEGQRVVLLKTALVEKPVLQEDSGGGPGTITWVDPDDADGDGVPGDICEVLWDMTGEKGDYRTGYEGVFRLGLFQGSEKRHGKNGTAESEEEQHHTSISGRAHDGGEDKTESRRRIARNSSRQKLAQSLPLRSSFPSQPVSARPLLISEANDEPRRSRSMPGLKTATTNSSERRAKLRDILRNSDGLSSVSTEPDESSPVTRADSFVSKQKSVRDRSYSSALIRVTSEQEDGWRATVNQTHLPSLGSFVRGEIDAPSSCKLYLPTSLLNSNCSNCGEPKKAACHTEQVACIYCYQTFTALANHAKACKVHCGDIVMVAEANPAARNPFPTFAWSCCPDRRKRCQDAADFREMKVGHSGPHTFKLWTEGSDLAR